VSSVLGIDGCKGGWTGVELRDGQFVDAHFHPTLAGIVAAVPAAVAVGVDMPLGLMDTAVRASDRAAQRLLAGRSSSIFVMPPRPVFDATDHATGSALSVALTGKGISIQAWGLKTKLLEAEALHELSLPPLFEVHPELSFREMGLLPSDGSKKTWRGQRARLRILAGKGIEIPEDLGPVVQKIPADDILDAAAAAWSAHRIGGGVAFCLPDPPQVNERGQQLAIWC
jgi:predicted RNase H-like nuclease